MSPRNLISRVLLLVLTFWVPAAGQVVAHSESDEVHFILTRFSEPMSLNMLQSSSWTLAHDYEDLERAMSVLKEFSVFIDALAKHSAGDMTPLETLGGVNRFKEKLAIWASDSDRAIRAFGCVVIGISGDKELVPVLLKVLKESPSDDENEFRYDRARALMALGKLGAVEQKSTIASFLKSSTRGEREGAVYALELLNANEYAPQIAAFLTERDSKFYDDTSPISFLIGTGTAREHKSALVMALNSFSSEVSTEAAYALVSIDAREHASNIARLLDDEFRRADAAKALALMGAKRYIPVIAKLLKDESQLVRSAGVLSLGILDAKDYDNQIAALLSDPKGSVGIYAATAILLMRAEKHYKEALPLMGDPTPDREFLTSVSEFNYSVKDKAEALTSRLRKNLSDAGFYKEKSNH
jgi:HEAT repeat protein